MLNFNVLVGDIALSFEVSASDRDGLVYSDGFLCIVVSILQLHVCISFLAFIVSNPFCKFISVSWCRIYGGAVHTLNSVLLVGWTIGNLLPLTPVRIASLSALKADYIR